MSNEKVKMMLGEVSPALHELLKDLKPGQSVNIPNSILAEIDAQLEPGFSNAMKEARETGGTIHRQLNPRFRHHGY